MALVYIGLGTNLGDKADNLQKAIQLISERIGKVIAISSFYDSKPWGFSSKNNFLNAAISVETTCPPIDILRLTQKIEKDMGRKSKTGKAYTDRIIDIDILLYDDKVIHSSELKIPHPLLQERDFVLIPLAEIASKITHPTLHKTIGELKVDLLSATS